MWKYIKKGINSDFINEPLDAKIDRVEADTQDIQTKVDTVDTVVDTINTNVGSNADSASATGSVHAKLKKIEDRLNFKNQNNASIFATVTQNIWYTLLNYSTTRGCLKQLMASRTSDLASLETRVTIDGNTTTFTVTTPTYGGAGYIFPQDIYFDSSLKIELRITAPTNLTLNANCIYLIP